ncbi:AtpZ/AtpI family protein [Paenibacillus aurantius]|uniref:AtpZ/AtpI family protein n=1 Tax=Paenibacillus aurantius TaxID=2918900 RepID=A0AA96RF35_9BACL|nr:AtpZ/AtpI family protein [Paenibacillus aurantius]WJH36264.1 AtpZ/AtpI family protein [Paenibacillus sp. CC-CFT747]WNQ11547.1 AtpZ/AtpI family protein [Paenibacillus aurantius]
MKDRKSDENPWRGAAIVSAMGADLAVCVGAGYWIGSKLDDRFGGGQLWTLVGLMAGLVIGGVGVFFLIRLFAEDNHD